MSRRKIYSLIAIGVLLSVLFPVSLSATGGKPDPAAGKPMEIDWLGIYKSGQTTGWFEEEIEAKFNVDITFNNMGANATPEKIDVMIASGEFPDVGKVWKEPKELYLGGVTRAVPQEMLEKYAPNYTNLFKVQYPSGWLMNKNPDNDKEYLCVLGITAQNLFTRHLLATRVHWAKRVGFDIPGYPENRIRLNADKPIYFLDSDITLEWLERLLVAYRDGDPDQNGKIDTIPWGAQGPLQWQIFMWTYAPIMGAFGVHYPYNALVDGEILEWCIMPGYKDFVITVARWWEKGLIDKEFTNLSWEAWAAKVGDGNIGATQAAPDYSGFPENAMVPPDNMIRDDEIGTDAAVVVLKPPIGPTGLQGARVYNPALGLRIGSFFGKKVDDTKLAKILQIMDHIYYPDTVEMWVHREYGQPGVHFDWAGEPYNSNILPKPMDEVGQGRWAAGYPQSQTKKIFKVSYPPLGYDFLVNYLLAEDKAQKWIKYPYRWDYLAETELGEMKIKYQADLDTFVDEWFLKALTGQIDIEAEWDGYVAQWRKLGGDKILEELEKSPIVSEFRKGNLVY